MANVKITKNYIPSGTMSRLGIKREKKWIVVHETGNRSAGAGAKNHAAYLQSVAKADNRYYSWHYTVDDGAIYQHMPDDEVAFHAGDGNKQDGGNYAGIGIEICVNPESDFSVAVDNAASLIADLLKAYDLDIEAVQQHNYFSGKNCPETIRSKGMWKSFLGMIIAYVNGGKDDSMDGKTPLFQAGQNVVLNGHVYLDSYGSKPGKKFSSKVCKVSRVVDTARTAPYLLDTTLGWAREEDLSAKGSVPAPITEGGRVRVRGSLYTNSYGGVPVRSISGIYTVTLIIPDRTAGVLLNGNMGWVRPQDCVSV